MDIEDIIGATATQVLEEKDVKTIKTFEGCPSETENQGKAKVCQGCPGQVI
jgi:hypothetical protein